MKKRIIWIALFSVAIVPSSWSRVIVVDPGGGGDVETIQMGLDVAVDGDTVSVMPGFYDEGAYLDFLGKAVVLESVGGPTVTTITADLDAIRINSGEGDGTVVRGFTVIAPYQFGGIGIYIKGTSPTIEQNIIKNCDGHGIHCTDLSEALIRDNLILFNSNEGIQVRSSARPTIERNFIYRNGGDGIFVQYGRTIIRENVIMESGPGWGVDASDAIVEGNLLVGNKNGIRSGVAVNHNVLIDNQFHSLQNGLGSVPEKRNNIIVGSNAGIDMTISWSVVVENNVLVNCGTGILIETGGDPHVVRNNIITDNDWGVYCLPGVQEIDLAYNDVWNSKSGDYFGCTPGEGSVSMDPGFVDPDNHHYALTGTSPLIDLGDPGMLDPDGTRSDMGAYGGPDAWGLALTVLPRDTVLSRGASLVYDLMLSNTTSLTQTVEGWAEVILSNRAPYPDNPLLGPVPISLDPYETLTLPHPITHPIPQAAPLGIYEYKAKVGLWPDDAMAERDFFFLVTP